MVHRGLFGSPVEMVSGLTDASGTFSLQMGKPSDYRSPNCYTLSVVAQYERLVTSRDLASYGADCGWRGITDLILILPPPDP